jgi:anthranilate phosphoribosyltransferase
LQEQDKSIKHGNYGASTVTGASNVLEELGYRFKINSEELNEDLKKPISAFYMLPISILL